MAISQPVDKSTSLAQVHTLLEADADVLALVLFGSLAQDAADPDGTSDIDLLLIVADAAAGRFWSSEEWLAPLGTIFGCEHHVHAYTNTLRVCFRDFRRYDFLIATRSAALAMEQWFHIPRNERRVLFVRDAETAAMLERDYAPHDITLLSDVEFERLVNGFWFKSVVFVNKLMRNDMLVALHLVREMVQDCLILAMHLRDRDIVMERGDHRWDYVLQKLETTQHTHDLAGMLNSAKATAGIFDQLASNWSASYMPRLTLFVAWLDSIEIHFADNSSPFA